MDIGPGVGVAGVDAHPRRMEVGEGPVDQVQVQVVEPEVPERLLAGRLDVAVPVVPQLGGDPELLTPDPAAHDLPEAPADELLVSVDGGAIEVTVADRGGAEHRLRDGLAREAVGAEGSEADGRHPRARAEHPRRNRGGVDPIFRYGEAHVRPPAAASSGPARSRGRSHRSASVLCALNEDSFLHDVLDERAPPHELAQLLFRVYQDFRAAQLEEQVEDLPEPIEKRELGPANQNEIHVAPLVLFSPGSGAMDVGTHEEPGVAGEDGLHRSKLHARSIHRPP